MNKPQPLQETSATSWLQKAKVAFAAFAFVAAAVFGVSTAADVAPQADDTAQEFSYERFYQPREDIDYFWSFPVPVVEDPEPAPVEEPEPVKIPWNPRDGGMYSMRSGSWS